MFGFHVNAQGSRTKPHSAGEDLALFYQMNKETLNIEELAEEAVATQVEGNVQCSSDAEEVFDCLSCSNEALQLAKVVST